jgi:hypothetical protein
VKRGGRSGRRQRVAKVNIPPRSMPVHSGALSPLRESMVDRTHRPTQQSRCGWGLHSTSRTRVWTQQRCSLHDINQKANVATPLSFGEVSMGTRPIVSSQHTPIKVCTLERVQPEQSRLKWFGRVDVSMELRQHKSRTVISVTLGRLRQCRLRNLAP